MIFNNSLLYRTFIYIPTQTKPAQDMKLMRFGFQMVTLSIIPLPILADTIYVHVNLEQFLNVCQIHLIFFSDAFILHPSRPMVKYI